MRKTLTQRVAQSATPAAKPFQIHDTKIPGFALRIQPSGSKSWKLVAEADGKRKTITLGQFPQMSCGMAIVAAQRVLQGIAPDTDADAPTLGEYLDETYGPWLRVHRRSGADLERRLRRFPFQGQRLPSITTAKWEKYRTSRLSAGIKPATLDRDLNSIKAAMNRAVEWDLISANPLARVKRMGGDQSGVVRYLTDDEQERLYRALESADPFLQCYVPLSLNTGLRKGEMFALKWADIDLDRKTMTVRGAGSKSGQTRFVQLNKTAIAALEVWQGQDDPPTGGVFPKRDFRWAWTTLLKTAEIENFRVHDMRHDFASRLVMAGVPINTIRELLGHADIAMTLKYAHLAPAAKQSAVDLIG